MELKLVGIARASLEELLGDYKDFLRQTGLVEWGKNHPMSQLVRRLAYVKNRSYKTYSTCVENAPPAVAANTVLCLIHQTNYLLDQQLKALERTFLAHGGFTERLYRARQQARRNSATPKTASAKNSSAHRPAQTQPVKPKTPAPKYSSYKSHSRAVQKAPISTKTAPRAGTAQ